MKRTVEANVRSSFKLVDNQVEQILDRTVTTFGNSAKADIPKRYIGRRVYVVVLK